MSGPEHAWVALYRGALLELDLEKLPEKIAVATSAMEERLLALDQMQEGREERRALQDALRNLRLLRRSEGAV